ncbi:MAG: protein-L-isoaspartate(D-aspartate) O-methyltransferase [Bacteroidales bacterium]|nr:protein-L-isoaspartate(D-aspartate) O-methyltransferase [Bacteroidales bacterium]
MTDSYKYKGLRKELINILRGKGIKDENVLNAILEVPRHYFFEYSFVDYAYQDKPFPIGAGQTISQPYTVAFQTELLNVKKGDKILEVGTGSGYQACILLKLGANVHTVERIKSLYLKAKNFLPSIGCYMKLFYGDGYKGLPAYAPFDKILVTAGAPYIPDDLLKQLKPGGIMVIPIGDSSKYQIMTRIKKISDTEFHKEEFGAFSFVPLLKDKSNE